MLFRNCSIIRIPTLLIMCALKYFTKYLTLFPHLESFEVQLIGTSPNAGQVEVRYNDLWANVCYKTSNKDTYAWNFANAEVACKEKGFPGTMIARQGSQEIGTRTHTIVHYKCKRGISFVARQLLVILFIHSNVIT